MKKLIIVAVVAAVVGGFVLYGGEVVEILKNETVAINNVLPETIVKTERVDNLDVLIKEAQDEAKGGIESEAKKTQDEEVAAAKATYEAEVAAAEAKHNQYIVDELVKISDKVKGDYIAEIEATITSQSY